MQPLPVTAFSSRSSLDLMTSAGVGVQEIRTGDLCRFQPLLVHPGLQLVFPFVVSVGTRVSSICYHISFLLEY